MFLEHYFDRYTFQPEKGLAYGFEKREAGYEYQCPVLSDTFLLKVRVCDQKISFQVYDQDTGDEYIQIHQEQLQEILLAKSGKPVMKVLQESAKLVLR